MRGFSQPAEIVDVLDFFFLLLFIIFNISATSNPSVLPFSPLNNNPSVVQAVFYFYSQSYLTVS